MKKVAALFLSGFFYLFLISIALAQVPSPPAPPAGTPLTLSEVSACESGGDWIEIYNSSSSTVQLTGWKILKGSTAGVLTGTIDLTGEIAATNYKKILISGNLSNNSFFVTLKDSDGDNVESFPSDTTKTESCPSTSTTTSWIKQGSSWMLTTTVSPDTANTLTVFATPTPTPNPTTIASPTPTATLTVQPTNIHLSEIYACQDDGVKEWVELYNSNEVDVTIEGWSLFDNGTSNNGQNKNEQELPTSLIKAKSYLIFEITRWGNGMLTNDGDTVYLYNGKGEEQDKREYSACKQSTTFAKIDGSWKETAKITKNAPNEYLAVLIPPTASASPTPSSKPSASPTPKTTPTPTPSSSPSPTPTPEGEVLGLIQEENVASIEPTPQIEQIKPKTDTFGTVMLIIGIFMLLGIAGYMGWEFYSKEGVKSISWKFWQ